MVHEAAQGKGLLTHISSVFGHTICMQYAAFFVAAPLNLNAIGDTLQASLKVRFAVQIVSLVHLRHMCMLAMAGQAVQLAWVF